MMLPQDLQPHLPHATLLLVSDSVSAKFFLAGGESLEELDGIVVPREIPQDNEGPYTFDIEDDARLKQFVNQVAKRAGELVHQHGVVHINVAMPAEVHRLWEDALLVDVREKILHVLHKDLMNESPIEVLRRIFSSKTP